MKLALKKVLMSTIIGIIGCGCGGAGDKESLAVSTSLSFEREKPECKLLDLGNGWQLKGGKDETDRETMHFSDFSKTADSRNILSIGSPQLNSFHELELASSTFPYLLWCSSISKQESGNIYWYEYRPQSFKDSDFFPTVLEKEGFDVTTINQNEYDYFIKYDGQSKLIKDWGVRVKCAPMKPTTPWQTTPCQ